MMMPGRLCHRHRSADYLCPVTNAVIPSPSAPVRPLDRRIWGLAAVGLGGFGLAGVYQLSAERLGILCPFHLITGLDCPLCGSTRMAAALLRGDLGAAWQFNAAVLILGSAIGVAVGYQILAWSLERVTVVRLLRLRLSPRTVQVVTTVVMGTLLAFGALRNL
jgi:hypothetical protein